MEVMRQAVLLQMTWTGAPTLYYGDEAGLGGFMDPDNRRTYPLVREDHSLILYHRILTGLRSTSRALRRGSVLRLPDADGLLVYARFSRGDVSVPPADRCPESFIVLININHDTIEYQADITCAGIPARAELECLLRTDRSGYTAARELLPDDETCEDSSAQEGLLPLYITDGILRISLPPESGILLRWKPRQGDQ